jgi:hypothetical protein
VGGSALAVLVNYARAKHAMRLATDRPHVLRQVIQACRKAGLYTPAPGDLPRLLGARLADRVRHVLVFPYDGRGHGGVWRRADEFVRCKLPARLR